MTVVISLLHRLIILERTSSRGATGSLNIHKYFHQMNFHPYRPKAVKNIRKIRAISYVLTEKPHTNQRLWKGAKRKKDERAGRCESVGNKVHHTLCTNSSSPFK